MEKNTASVSLQETKKALEDGNKLKLHIPAQLKRIDGAPGEPPTTVVTERLPLRFHDIYEEEEKGTAELGQLRKSNKDLEEKLKQAEESLKHTKKLLQKSENLKKALQCLANTIKH